METLVSWKEVESIIMIEIATSLLQNSTTQQQLIDILNKKINKGIDGFSNQSDYIQEGSAVLSRMLKSDENDESLLRRICWIKEKECKQWAFKVLPRLIDRMSLKDSEQLVKEARLILTIFVDIYRQDRPRTEFKNIYSSLLIFMNLLGGFDERGHRVCQSNSPLIHFFGIQIESILKNEVI